MVVSIVGDGLHHVIQVSGPDLKLSTYLKAKYLYEPIPAPPFANAMRLLQPVNTALFLKSLVATSFVDFKMRLLYG